MSQVYCNGWKRIFNYKNDAPVIALAGEGVAMGGSGSDATIETADIVIQNDQPSKIVSAIRVEK